MELRTLVEGGYRCCRGEQCEHTETFNREGTNMTSSHHSVLQSHMYTYNSRSIVTLFSVLVTLSTLHIVCHVTYILQYNIVTHTATTLIHGQSVFPSHQTTYIRT